MIRMEMLFDIDEIVLGLFHSPYREARGLGFGILVPNDLGSPRLPGMVNAE